MVLLLWLLLGSSRGVRAPSSCARLPLLAPAGHGCPATRSQSCTGNGFHAFLPKFLLLLSLLLLLPLLLLLLPLLPLLLLLLLFLSFLLLLLLKARRGLDSWVGSQLQSNLPLSRFCCSVCSWCEWVNNNTLQSFSLRQQLKDPPSSHRRRLSVKEPSSVGHGGKFQQLQIFAARWRHCSSAMTRFYIKLGFEAKLNLNYPLII